MAKRRPRGPRDPTARAKLIGDLAAGLVEDEPEDGKDAAAVAFAAVGVSRAEKPTLPKVGGRGAAKKTLGPAHFL